MPYKMVFNTDGGCLDNGKPYAIGAAACCLKNRWTENYTYKTRILPRLPTPTSQRAELTAVILALEWALERYEELRGYPKLRVTIMMDSKYVFGCMTEWVDKWMDNGWLNARGTDVANRDLIEEALELEERVEELGTVNYVWVPREENYNADQCCRDALMDQ